MFQRVFLSVITKLGLFVMQLSGLWPFAYDRKSKKFKFLWYFTFTPIIILGYTFVVSFFWSKLDIPVKNTVVSMLLEVFLTFNSVNFLIVFACHWLRLKEMKTVIPKAIEVIADLKIELDSSEFRYGNFLLKLTFKSVFLMLILVIVILGNMKRYNEDYVFHLMTALPIVIIKLQPDAFFAGLLLTEFYLSRINDKVSRVMTEAKDLSENNDSDEHKRYQSMIDFCKLSDILDRLCALQCSVTEICESFVRIFSLQITLWMAVGLMVFLVNMFQQYISITTSFRDEFSVEVFLNDLVATGMVMVELYMTATTSDSLMTESRRTGVLLNMPLMRRNVDVRFKRSVEIYSGRVLLKSLNVTALGLFHIDAALIYSAVSTATSYLIILIQFELTLRKTN